MKSFRIASLALLVMALVATGCSKDNPIGPGSSPLEGTWLLMTHNGGDFSDYGGYYTFTKDRLTVGNAAGNCTATYSYVIQGDKVISTLLTDECEGEAAGTKDTVTFKVEGNKLTATVGNDVFTSERGTPRKVAGYWQVISVDGEQLPDGVGQQLRFGHRNFTIAKFQGGEEACTAKLSYTESGSKLTMKVLDSGCEGLEVGVEDTATYTINGSTITVKFSDNTTVVAMRI